MSSVSFAWILMSATMGGVFPHVDAPIFESEQHCQVMAANLNRINPLTAYCLKLVEV